jgi:hypothetical protein
MLGRQIWVRDEPDLVAEASGANSISDTTIFMLERWTGGRTPAGYSRERLQTARAAEPQKLKLSGLPTNCGLERKRPQPAAGL